MTDDVGMLQHARFTTPDRNHGYCTDDNARRLVVALQSYELTQDVEMLKLARRYLSFVHHAFNPDGGRFRNFMTYDRRWEEEAGSEDSHARALWGLGSAVALGDMTECGRLRWICSIERYIPPTNSRRLELGRSRWSACTRT